VAPREFEWDQLIFAFDIFLELSYPLLGRPSLDQKGSLADYQGPAPSAPSQGGASSNGRPNDDPLTCRTRRRPLFYVYEALFIKLNDIVIDFNRY
jgi:hypothetical protein